MRKKAFFFNQRYEQIYNTKQTFTKGDFNPETLDYIKSHLVMIFLGIIAGVPVICGFVYVVYALVSQDIVYSLEMKIAAFFVFMFVAVPFVLLLHFFSDYIRSAIRYGRLDNRGVIIEGELLQANNRTPDGSKTADLTVTYTFTTPKKHTLIARQSHQRPDLMNKPLPRKGTQVKILYATDDDYVML